MAFEDYFSQVEQDGVISIYDTQNNRKTFRLIAMGAILIAALLYVDGKHIELVAASAVGSLLFFAISFIVSKHILVLAINKRTNTVKKGKQEILIPDLFCQRIESVRLSREEGVEYILYLVKSNTKTISIYNDSKSKLMALSRRIGQHTNLPLDE